MPEDHQRDRATVHLTQLAEDVLARAIEIWPPHADPSGPERRHARDLQAIARCMVDILSNRAEPLAHYLTPEF